MAVPKVTKLLLGKRLCQSSSLEELWHGTAIALFALIALSSFPLFILISLQAQRMGLAYILSAFWILTALIYTSMLKFGNIKFASRVAALVCAMLFFYLLITGAAENTGILWCYIVVPIIFQMLGAFSGLFVNTALVVGTLVIFYWPNLGWLQADYSAIQKSRFVLSYLVLSTLAFVHEYARSRANQRLNELKEQFRKASHRDSLTRLANRREAKKRLALEENLASDPEYCCAVVLADVDFFKKINDGFGHDCGDYVLKKLSTLLQQSTRKSDLVVRWGGEEFLLLLAGAPSETAVKICQNIQLKLQQANFCYNDRPVRVSLSFGISHIDHQHNSKQALAVADQHLYQAKRRGRDCIVVDGERVAD